jgi:hypothetical protein
MTHKEMYKEILNAGFFLRDDTEIWLSEAKEGKRPTHTYSLCAVGCYEHPFQRVHIYSCENITWAIEKAYEKIQRPLKLCDWRPSELGYRDSQYGDRVRLEQIP